MSVVAQPSECLDFETSDQESSTDGYAQRFSGPVGEWMLSVQESTLMKLLGDRAGATVLDVGGGHGQIAAPLIRAGFKVTVLGSSEGCKNRLGGLIDEKRLSFVVGNPLSLPFPDKHFDVVTCFRLLSHTEKWERLIAELKRVSKHSVIIDFPPLYSFNLLNPLLFRMKKKLEGNTRTFRIFTCQQIATEMQRSGIGKLNYRRQFFLPMVLHRRMENLKVSVFLEKLFFVLGLTYLFGSPVIVEWIGER